MGELMFPTPHLFCLLAHLVFEVFFFLPDTYTYMPYAVECHGMSLSKSWLWLVLKVFGRTWKYAQNSGVPCFDISLPPACWVSLGMSLSHSTLGYPCLFDGWSNRSPLRLSLQEVCTRKALGIFLHFFYNVFTSKKNTMDLTSSFSIWLHLGKMSESNPELLVH